MTPLPNTITHCLTPTPDVVEAVLAEQHLLDWRDICLAIRDAHRAVIAQLQEEDRRGE